MKHQKSNKKKLIPFIVLSSIVLVTGVVLASVLPTTCKKVDKKWDFSFNTQDFINFDRTYNRLLYPINITRDYTTGDYSNDENDELMLSDFSNIIDENYGFGTLFACSYFYSCHNYLPWDQYAQPNIYHFNELTANFQFYIHFSGSCIDNFEVNFSSSYWYYEIADRSNVTDYEFSYSAKFYIENGKGFNFNYLKYPYGSNPTNTVSLRFASEAGNNSFVKTHVKIYNCTDDVILGEFTDYDDYMRADINNSRNYFPNIKFVSGRP